MAGNTVMINNIPSLEWYVGDSKIEAVISVLDAVGTRNNPVNSNPEPARVLSEPAKHTLEECLEELKRGRPAADQIKIDHMIMSL